MGGGLLGLRKEEWDEVEMGKDCSQGEGVERGLWRAIFMEREGGVKGSGVTGVCQVHMVYHTWMKGLNNCYEIKLNNA